MEKDFDILLKFEDGFEEASFLDFYKTVNVDNLKFKFLCTPPMGPMAGVEWLMPTAAILYITKPYFESFLSEMGKDHYSLLKKGAKLLWSKFFEKKESQRILVSSNNAPNKINNDIFSFDFSIVIMLENKRKIKLLIPKTITRENFEVSVECFFDFIKQYIDGKADIEEENFIFDKDVLVTYNIEKNELEFLNPIIRR